MSAELALIWRHGRVYAFGRVLDRLAALCLIPILVHVLSPEEWGIYAIILVVSEVLAVAPMGVLYTMIRLYFDDQAEGHRRRVIGTTFLLLAAAAVVLTLLAWPLARLTVWALLDQPAHVLAFTLANLGIAFNLLFELELDYLRAEKRSVVFVVVTLARSLLQFALSIALVVVWHLGVIGVVLGQLAAVILVSLPLAAAMIARFGLTYDPAVASEMARIGLPLIPAWLGRSALDFVDRGLVNALGGTAMLGLYALGARLADQLRTLMTGPFSDIWRVRLLERASRAEAAVEFNRAQLFFLALLALAVLALSAFAPEIVALIAAPAFQGAAEAVPLLALSHLLRTVAYHFQLGLLERKRTGSLPFVNWSTVALAALALWLLIPRFGILGAAAAILLAQAGRLALSAWFAALHSDYVRLFPWRSYCGILSLSVAFYAAIAAVSGAEISPVGVLVKLALLAAFTAALYLCPIFTAAERGAMRRSLRRLARRPETVASKGGRHST